MKIKFILAAFFTGLFALIIFIIVFSFAYVKKTADTIIRLERDKFVEIVSIPNAVAPSNPSFESISYVWEMETPQGEVATVRVNQSTAFGHNVDKIILSVEREVGGDPSIFDKVLPAVVIDEQALKSAQNPKDQNLGPNEKYRYNNIKIEYSNTQKPIKISWEFDKAKTGDNLLREYEKLNKIPPSLLKTSYTIYSTVILLLSG